MSITYKEVVSGEPFQIFQQSFSFYTNESITLQQSADGEHYTNVSFPQPLVTPDTVTVFAKVGTWFKINGQADKIKVQF